jgi:hypothetical protein
MKRVTPFVRPITMSIAVSKTHYESIKKVSYEKSALISAICVKNNPCAL